MRIVCEYKDSPPPMSWLMGDLKTVKGYLNRLKSLKGVKLKEFIIYSEPSNRSSGNVRYLAFSSNLKRYYDYNEHEFRSTEYLIKKYSAIPYSISF